jgi:hypothetical protein
MPGYLAFDRDALGMLRSALELALYELNATVGYDPAAAKARARSQQAARSGEAWVPTLRGLTSCMTLEAYSPVGIDSSDLAQAYFLQLAGGRSIVTDPLSADVSADLDARATALAKVLRDGNLNDFQDAKDKAWLRQELAAIDYSPSACKAFIDALGSDKFIELNNLLADQAREHPLILEHDLLPDGTPELLATLDSLGRVFGQFRAGASESELDSWDELLEAEVAPLALIRLVGAGINIDRAWSDNAVQAALTSALWQLDVVRDAALGTDAINLLAERPVVAQEFLEDTDNFLLQEVLTYYGPDARGRLLLASSDPSVFTPEEVKISMQHVIEVLTHMTGQVTLKPFDPMGIPHPSWPDELDTYFGQYLPELLREGNLRTTLGQPESGWNDGVGPQNDLAHLLILLADHPTLFNQFEARATAMMFGAQQLDDPELQGAAAYVIGALADVRAYQRANDIETVASGIGLGVAAASYIPFGIPGTPLTIGGVIGLADGAGVTDAALDAAGLNVRDAIAAGQSDVDWLTVVMERQALAAWAARHQAGVVPPLPPRPAKAKSGDDATKARQEYDEALDAWIKTLDPNVQDKVKLLRSEIRGRVSESGDVVAG